MVIKKETLKDIIEDATRCSVKSIKKVTQTELFDATYIYITVILEVRESIKHISIVSQQLSNFIYNVDFHELMDEDFNLI